MKRARKSSKPVRSVLKYHDVIAADSSLETLTNSAYYANLCDIGAGNGVEDRVGNDIRVKKIVAALSFKCQLDHGTTAKKFTLTDKGYRILLVQDKSANHTAMSEAASKGYDEILNDSGEPICVRLRNLTYSKQYHVLKDITWSVGDYRFDTHIVHFKTEFVLNVDIPVQYSGITNNPLKNNLCCIIVSDLPSADLLTNTQMYASFRLRYEDDTY